MKTASVVGDPERAHAPKGGRASRVAIDKRRAARHFNDVLLGGASRSKRLDGRTEKRRQRILAELKEGSSRTTKKELKPIDVLLRVQSLLDLDEPLASIKKARGAVKPVPANDELVEGLRALHAAYGFSATAYQFVGIDEVTLRKAGIRGGPAPALKKVRATTASKRAPTRAVRTTAARQAVA